MSRLNEEDSFSLNVERLNNNEVIELPVFDERVITNQPNANEFSSHRRPIPVSTVEWRTTHLNQMTPVSGLDFLTGAEQVTIEQTVGIDDLRSTSETENRYVIKIPQGETLYTAEESSRKWQRNLCGSGRGFSIVVLDQTRQFCMQMHRRLACSNCFFGCWLQYMEVWIPPGDLLGKIRQVWTCLQPTFVIENDDGSALFRLEGPANLTSCSLFKDASFNILSPDGLTQLGVIRNQWDQLMVGYNICVYFPQVHTDVKDKALLIAAAFLIEYMYFERAKSSRKCSCLC